ncbi:MAG: hypothetical protein ACJ8FY_19950 [Gemmataceae bacterium]
MAFAVICPGCGHTVSLSDDYLRRKIRCPDCGVYCDVPQADKRNTAAKAGQKAASPPSVPANAWIDDILFTEKPAVTCSTCGTKLRPNEAAGTPERICGGCQGLADKKAGFAREKPVAATAAGAAKKKPLEDDPDDGSPYRLAERLGAACPQCGEEVPKTATSCSWCSHTWEEERKPDPTYEPVQLEWESGFTYRKRKKLFVLAQVFGLFVAAVSLAGGALGTFLANWLVTTPMLVFLLGTYPRLNLSRNKRGRIILTKTWRACFWQRETETIDLTKYVGVATGKQFDGGMTNWLFFLVFLATGVVPAFSWIFSSESSIFTWVVFFVSLAMGLLPSMTWAYLTLYKEIHFVALTQDHGYKAYNLYQGLDGDQAEEIAEAVQNIAGMPYENV